MLALVPEEQASFEVKSIIDGFQYTFRLDLFRLFLVITFNGLVSMMCAAIFIELERPEQIQRQEAKEELRREVDSVRRNLTHLIQSSWADDSEVRILEPTHLKTNV